MDLYELCTQLDAIETRLLSAAQELQVIKAGLRVVISNSSPLESFLTAEQVAKILDVDVPYVYGLARAGKIPSIKLGKYRRFSPLQVRKWLERKATR
jgi:excisionase family DNA binding protein